MASPQESNNSEDVAGLAKNLEATNLQPPSRPIPLPQSLPTTLTRSYSILGVPTHTFCQVFSDRIVVGVSQLPSKHIGNWTLCQAQRSEVSPKDIDFDVSILLGDHNDAMLELYARRLTECVIQQRLIPGTDRMVILLGMSLQKKQPGAGAESLDADRKKFGLVVDTLTNLIKEALGVALNQGR